MENDQKPNGQAANEYLLLFRGTSPGPDTSPEAMQAFMNRWMSWYEGLVSEGKIRAAAPLEEGGKLVSGKQGERIEDGPFAETKETVGGYFLLQVETMEAAVGIAKQCPGIEYGGCVEVRQIAECCPTMRQGADAPAAEPAIA